MFLINMLLCLIWVALTADLSPANLLFGFVAGFFILWMMRRIEQPSRYYYKAGHAVRLTLIFCWELIKANIRVAWDVLTPTHYMRPGIVAIPLDAKTDEQITLLANMITLTPGTLSLDVSEDRKVLYIHSMYIKDVEQTRREIKEGFERAVIEVLE